MVGYIILMQICESQILDKPHHTPPAPILWNLYVYISVTIVVFLTAEYVEMQWKFQINSSFSIALYLRSSFLEWFTCMNVCSTLVPNEEASLEDTEKCNNEVLLQ